MKLKIISDGTTKGTFVTNADTGEHIEDVTAIYVSAQGNSTYISAEIHVLAPKLEITRVEAAKTNAVVTSNMDIATAKINARRSWKYTEVGKMLIQSKGKKVRGGESLQNAYVCTLLKEAGIRGDDNWNRWIDKYYTVGRFDGSIASFKTIADKLEEYFNIGPQIANKLRKMILSQELPTP